MINYYIVVNSRTNFSSLCEAYNSVPGMNVYSMSLKQSKIENSIHKKATAHSLGVRKNAHEIFLGKNDVLVSIFSLNCMTCFVTDGSSILYSIVAYVITVYNYICNMFITGYNYFIIFNVLKKHD